MQGNTLSATVSGSFNRHYSEIKQIVDSFKDEGIVVLSPRSSRVKSNRRGFVRLESDRGTPGTLESAHLTAIASSDFLYVYDPGGYIGLSTALEIGFALRQGLPVFVFERPDDIVFSSLVRVAPSAKKVKQILLSRREPTAMTFPAPPSTVGALQAYVRRVSQLRGFSNESLRDIIVLFMEEIGELARAVRENSGLKVALSSDRSRSSVAEELADCLIYILHIANVAKVDLESAVREKEKLNASKKWGTRRTR